MKSNGYIIAFVVTLLLLAVIWPMIASDKIWLTIQLVVLAILLFKIIKSK